MDLMELYVIVVVPYVVGFVLGGLNRLKYWGNMLLIFVCLTGGIIPTMLNAASGKLDDMGEWSVGSWVFAICWWVLVAFIGFVAGLYMTYMYERLLPECRYRSDCTGSCLHIDTPGLPDCYEKINSGSCPLSKELRKFAYRAWTTSRTSRK